MFIYLSKKIAIPNGVKLKSLSWNGVNGWIVCGGESGLLKVLKLDSGRATDKAKGMATAGDLLKRYGPAYLLTSVSFAAVSYATCYVAVARGVNVVGLMTRVGLKASAGSEKVGTASFIDHARASPRSSSS